MVAANRPRSGLALWRDSRVQGVAVPIGWALVAAVALVPGLEVLLVTAAALAAVALMARQAGIQRFAFQAAFVLAVVLVARILIQNLTSELDQTNLEALPFVDLSWSFPFLHVKLDFLGQRAGFGLAETSFGRAYTADNSYGEAYLAGLLNTLRVALLGIFLATAIGLVVGVSRLSTNWLVARLATLYVEIFRNVPLLVQLIFWFTAVILQFPKIRENASIFNIILISNRSIALPWVSTESGFGLWLLLVLAGAGVAAITKIVRTRREEQTGQSSYPWWWAFGTFAAISAVTFVIAGMPLESNRPDLDGRAYSGGLQFSPEFTALLVGLTLYTASFIAEIVRGSIQAISKGQTEASAALGLSALQRLRYVILPQAMRIMIPPITNQYLNLTKNSSLGVAVAFPDLFRVTRITINQSGQAVAMILLVMVTYLAFSLAISVIMNLLNSRLQVPSR